MRRPFFYSKERQEELYRVLEEWKGTPHRHLVAVKGLGADCALFTWEVFKESGVLGIKNLPNIPKAHGHINYPPDRAIHSKDEVLLNVLRKVESLNEISKNAVPINGDICCYQFGKSTAHLGIYYDGHVYHSLTQRAVHPTIFSDRKMRKRLSAIFRIMEEVE